MTDQTNAPVVDEQQVSAIRNILMSCGVSVNATIAAEAVVKYLGERFAAQPAPQADEWTADGLHRPTLERAAGVCENRASVIRMAGITENMDPLEVELLDREHTRTEHAIRALAKKADHGE